MLRRKMYDRLLDWKDDLPRKVLLLLGARQTGKTFIVREFARSNYESFVEVNFLEDEENGRFLAGAQSSEELINRLSLIIGHPIMDGTLIFLDEVQHLGAEVVTLSKFLLDDGRFQLILSGSLLGTALEGITSFPVGYARMLRMYPLDFEEFCWAMGVPHRILETVRECYHRKIALESSLHDRLIRLFRQYIVVGGMPEAVQRFLDHRHDLSQSRAVNADIIEQYRYDIIKYATGRKTQILDIFENIPSQLAKVNKRFTLKSVKRNATFDTLENDFAWLSQAGVALPAHLVNEPKHPLMRTKVTKKFKFYSSDCGMLLAQYPLACSRGIISGDGDGNYGAVYENVVAQQLLCAGFPLLYYNNNRKGEIDFLVETNEGGIIPIEVKSGKDYKLHTALNNLLGTRDYPIDYAYVLSEFNTTQQERHGKPVYYLPLYMALCFEDDKNEESSAFILDEISFDD